MPDQLYFYVGSGKTETRLRRTAGTFEPTTVAHRFRDPLTQESLTASEMRQRAYADLKAGNAVSAAGRYTLLCAAECTVGDLEALAAADLGARLFPQADKACAPTARTPRPAKPNRASRKRPKSSQKMAAREHWRGTDLTIALKRPPT